MLRPGQKGHSLLKNFKSSARQVMKLGEDTTEAPGSLKRGRVPLREGATPTESRGQTAPPPSCRVVNVVQSDRGDGCTTVCIH